MNIKEFLSQKYWVIKLKKMAYVKRKIVEDAIIMQTPFLPQSSTIQQRGWHIMNNINCVPICPMCNNHLKFRKDNMYSKYCSINCSTKSPETIRKRKVTEVKKYGDEKTYREYKANILKKYSLEKYGVNNLFQAEEIKKKIKNTLNVVKNKGE